MAQKMTQGLVDRQGLLLGLSQPIEVVQHPERVVAQGKIQLAAAAQFQAEQEQSPPAEKAGLIIHHRLEARVGRAWSRELSPGQKWRTVLTKARPNSRTFPPCGAGR